MRKFKKTVQCFGVAGSHPYFSGGYITQVHGRDDFDAIQVETPRDLRIERGEEGRLRFGHALGTDRTFLDLGVLLLFALRLLGLLHVGCRHEVQGQHSQI